MTPPWRSLLRTTGCAAASAAALIPARTQDTWHHWACTFGTAAGLRPNLSRRRAGGRTRPAATSAPSDLAIGSSFGSSLDEATVTPALAACGGQSLRRCPDAVADFRPDPAARSTWTFALPGVDRAGRLLPDQRARVDALEQRDTAQRPARLARRDRHQAARPNTSFYSVDDSETSSATTYRCVAGDTNLVLDTTCKPQVANPPADFRNGDIVQTTYAEVDPWYASAITDTAAALRRGRHPHLLRQPDQRWPCEPCDRYAHCTVTAAQPAVEAAGAPAQAAWRRKPLLRLGLLVSLDRCPWRRRPRLMRPATSSSRSTTRRLR
ncbi:MAG: hypothetical protein R2851_02390 [Caldilineaceae bacterium]